MTGFLLHWLLLAQEGADFSTSVMGHHHAMAAHGPLEYVIVGIGAIVTVLVMFYTVKWFLRPQETSANHIKRRVLRDGF